MKNKILFMVVVFSVVSAQGEHPTGAKKAEHPSASITPQIVQGEKITMQNLARAIESFVEADINLRGAFLVIDPRTNDVLKLNLEKVHKERLSHVGDNVYFACADFNADDGTVYDLDIFLQGNNTDNLSVTEISVHKEDGIARYGWQEQNGRWVKKYD
tara:strand:+ start:138 stop:611 length:474 start_codon:yes stop_codon:yes gene_type:complete